MSKAKAKHKLKTPSWVLKDKTQEEIWEEEAEQIELIKSHMFEKIPDFSGIRVKPEVMFEAVYSPSFKGFKFKDLQIVADYYHIDISSFRKLDNRVEAMTHIRKKVKEIINEKL